jgi:hypothetical protein
MRAIDFLTGAGFVFRGLSHNSHPERITSEHFKKSFFEVLRWFRSRPWAEVIGSRDPG